jgi:hypothetical protein
VSSESHDGSPQLIQQPTILPPCNKDLLSGDVSLISRNVIFGLSQKCPSARLRWAAPNDPEAVQWTAPRVIVKRCLLRFSADSSGYLVTWASLRPRPPRPSCRIGS